MKKILLLMLACILALSGQAQTTTTTTHKESTATKQSSRKLNLDPGHYFSAGLRLGMGTMMFNQDFGSLLLNDKRTNGTLLGGCGGIDLGYQYYFSRHFGIATGLNIYQFNSSYTRSSLVCTADGTATVSHDGVQEIIATQYTYTTSTVDETYTTQFFEVPIFFTARSKYWHVNAGVKIAMPVRTDASYTYGETQVAVGNDVYGTGVSLDEPMPVGTCAGDKGNYDFGNKLLSSYMLGSVEVGYRVTDKFNNIWNLGVYLDCAFHGTTVDNSYAPDFFSLTNGTPAYTHCMESNLADSHRFLQFGIKAQYNFRLNLNTK